jgi:hypothetical protein
MIVGAAEPAVQSLVGRRELTRGEVKCGLPVVPGSQYLALGDSVTFGFMEGQVVPAPDYRTSPLHVKYKGSQLAFALSYLHRHSASGSSR